jgi:hypothetical protein
MLHSRLFRSLALLALGLTLANGTARRAPAAEVKLKNGTVLRGALEKVETLPVGLRKTDHGPITIYPILMIYSPLKRCYVPVRQMDVVNNDFDLSREGGIKLLQTKRPGSTGRVIASVQGFTEKPGPFDEWGRRTVRLEMAGGETPVIQGVTRITPEYIQITALNFVWDTAIATSSVPPESLAAMLRHVTDENNPDDRLRLARFFIDAERYELAAHELEAIRVKFPELADTIGQVQISLAQALARQALNELKLRRAAGQHQFAYEKSLSFPVENIAAPLLREVREIVIEYEQAYERKERVVAELGELQAQLKDDPRVKDIAPLRIELVEKLNYANLDRLDAYFKLAADPQLGPQEKLALAFSGWVVGSANAVTEINQALHLWQARFLLQDYLRSATEAAGERREILGKLAALEGVGPDRIAQIVPLLPPPLDPGAALAGQAVRIPVPDAKEGAPIAYWVSLPSEYHPDHLYPLIIALHGELGGPRQELQGFWGGNEDRGGQSQRHGCIVIAPEYSEKADRKGYDYNSASHQVVLDSLRDARRRFSVDSDRIFLTGHGMGGDAAWDIGLSHPYLFAGVMPINGAVDRHAKAYLTNGRQLPFYAVGGDLNLEMINRNGTSLMQMMQQNFDLIYTEYVGAGPDSFYSEIHSLFEWMERHKRLSPPKQVSARTLRETDNRFYWLELSGIPDNLKGIDWAKAQHRPQGMAVSATIHAGSLIRVSSGADHHRLWIPRGEGLVDFEKRLKVEINGRVRWNDFLKPDVEAMLEHVRLTGDQQQLYWAVLEF